MGIGDRGGGGGLTFAIRFDMVTPWVVVLAGLAMMGLV